MQFTGINVLSIFLRTQFLIHNDADIFRSGWQCCLDPNACEELHDWKSPILGDVIDCQSGTALYVCMRCGE